MQIIGLLFHSFFNIIYYQALFQLLGSAFYLEVADGRFVAIASLHALAQKFYFCVVVGYCLEQFLSLFVLFEQVQAAT